MRLVLGLVADHAQVADGKLFVSGEFTYLWAKKVPTQHSSLALVLRFEAPAHAVANKKPSLRIRFVDMDGTDLFAAPPPMELRFAPAGEADRGNHRAQAIIVLSGLPIPRYGKYVIPVEVDEKSVGDISFFVARPTGASVGPGTLGSKP